MIPVPSGVTDMRRGMPGLSLQVQQALGRDPERVGSRKKLCAPCDYAQLAEGSAAFSASELSEGGRSYGSVLNIILIFFQAHLA